MIIKDNNNEQLASPMASKVKYGDLTVGESVLAFEKVTTPKGCCDYYKVIPLGSDKVHYLYTSEVESL